MIKKLNYLLYAKDYINTHYLFDPGSKNILPINENQSLDEASFCFLDFFPDHEIYMVYIYKFFKDIFYAYLCLKKKSEKIEVNYPCGQALEIANLLKIPIYVDKKILEEQGIKVTAKMLTDSFDLD